MTMSSTNSAMSADSLLDSMVESLPARASNASSPSSPTPVIKDAYAATGLFGHACMLAAGFRLVGLGEDHKLDTGSEAYENGKKLPEEWDATNTSTTYAFRYAHSQSSMEYLIKVSRLGGKALVNAVAMQDDAKTASFEIRVQEYISEQAIKQSASTSDVRSAIRSIFLSMERMADLSTLFKFNVIQKLAPGIHKEGYQETPETTQRDSLRNDDDNSNNESRPAAHPPRPNPFHNPPPSPPRRRPIPVPTPDFLPPDFEDEHQMNARPGAFPDPYGARRPLNIGERDLYPPGLGPHDPLGVGPGRGGGLGGAGGMHPTFDDPLFSGGGRGGDDDGQPYDPRLPPGARYDPIGPGDDGPPNSHVRGRGSWFPGGRGGGGGGGGGPGSRGGNPFGGLGSGDFI